MTLQCIRSQMKQSFTRRHTGTVMANAQATAQTIHPLSQSRPHTSHRHHIMSEDQKPTEHLSLKVKNNQGNEVYFKVKKSTEFRKLMTAYCQKVGAQPGQVRFLFDGERIMPDDTPEKLQMENEDEIDAMVEQTGGH